MLGGLVAKLGLGPVFPSEETPQVLKLTPGDGEVPRGLFLLVLQVDLPPDSGIFRMLTC